MNQEKEFLRSRMQSMSLQGALKIKGEFTVIWKKRGCSHISSAKFGGIQIPCQVGRFVDLHAIASCYSTHYCRGKAPSDTIAIAIRPDFVLGKKTDIIFFNHNQVSRFRCVKSDSCSSFPNLHWSQDHWSWHHSTLHSWELGDPHNWHCQHLGIIQCWKNMKDWSTHTWWIFANAFSIIPWPWLGDPFAIAITIDRPE